MKADLTFTILDLPEIRAVLREAIDAVPEWERAGLQERLDQIHYRALEHRLLRGDPIAKPVTGIINAGPLQQPRKPAMERLRLWLRRMVT